MTAKRNYRLIFGVSFVMVLFSCASGYAQLKDTHILGDYGLGAGTQSPPSVSVFVPVNGYNASKFADSDGNRLDAPHLDTYVLGLGGSIVTNLKILGANYGASLLLAFASDKIDGTNVYSKSSLAFSDMYIQPVQLGWHWKKWDLTFGYALYIPTGKYELGGDSNSGLGMWSNEFSVGGTWHMDAKKTFNLSTVAFYSIHSKKKGTDMKVGNVLTLEGGLGKTFEIPAQKYRSAWTLSFGPVYYMQFKTTKDKIPVGDQTFYGSKDHIYGLGLEASLIVPKIYTMLSVRWLGEIGAKNRFQGNTFMITLAQPIKFFTKK